MRNYLRRRSLRRGGESIATCRKTAPTPSRRLASPRVDRPQSRDGRRGAGASLPLRASLLPLGQGNCSLRRHAELGAAARVFRSVVADAGLAVRELCPLPVHSLLLRSHVMKVPGVAAVKRRLASVSTGAGRRHLGTTRRGC